MNSTAYLNNAQEISTIYNNWLATNFNSEINTNLFQPEFEDDMDTLHEYDPYDYLAPSFEYTECFDDEMFTQPPNLELYSDSEDENFDTYDYARNIQIDKSH